VTEGSALREVTLYAPVLMNEKIAARLKRLSEAEASIILDAGLALMPVQHVAHAKPPPPSAIVLQPNNAPQPWVVARDDT
jgi:hypothetical protein